MTPEQTAPAVIPGTFFMSPDIDKLATALAKAQGEMKGAPKDAENPFFKSTYADLGSVWGVCREPFAKNGLCMVQLPRADGRKVTLVYALLHSSGQFIGSDLAMMAMKEDAQAVGSVITYARRYTLAAMAGIYQYDDDGNVASGKVEVLDRYDGKTPDLKAELQKLAKEYDVGTVSDLQSLSKHCIGVPMKELRFAIEKWLKL